MSRINSAGAVLTNTFAAFSGRDLLAGQRRLHVLPVRVGGELGEALRQLARHGAPGALPVRGLQPVVVVAEIVGLGRRVLEEIPVRVHRELQVVAEDGAPDGVAVEVDDDRGRLAEVDRRRIRLDPRHLLRRDLAPVDAGQHAVERDHALLLGDRGLDLRHHLADLLPRDGGEVGLRDLEDREVDQPLLGGHLGVGFDLDAAESGLRRPLWPPRTRRNTPPCASGRPSSPPGAGTRRSGRRSAWSTRAAIRRRPGPGSAAAAGALGAVAAARGRRLRR